MAFPEPERVWGVGDGEIEAVEMLRFLLGEKSERPVPWGPRR